MIRNIWAVGRNYADHAKELGNAVPAPQGAPMIFLKSGATAVPNGQGFALPAFSQDIHFETEIALQFGPRLEFSAITIALDLTARDIQNQLKSQGHPWTLAKSFKASCPLGPLQPLSPTTDLTKLEFSLRVNGELRQKGNTADMIHAAESLRRYVIERFPVEEGDLLLTGTPAGVAKLNSGDHLEAEISGILRASWHVR